MRPENKAMVNYLAAHGFPGVAVKYLWHGSLKGCWRLYREGPSWTEGDAYALNMLGFRNFDNKPLSLLSSSACSWQVFIRGHDELLHGIEGPRR